LFGILKGLIAPSFLLKGDCLKRIVIAMFLALSLQGTASAFTKQELIPMVKQAAQRHGIPERILINLVEVESDWDCRAISSAGALGLAQLKPYHFRNGEKWSNPKHNLNASARLLKGYYLKFGSWHRALTAYNRGITITVSRGLYRSRYSEKILNGKRN
jgi:soluble lytic murein transglycosylase-like protein